MCTLTPNATAPLGTAVALAPPLGSRATTTALAIPAGTLVVYTELRGSHGSATAIPLAELRSSWQRSPPSTTTARLARTLLLYFAAVLPRIRGGEGS